MLYIIKAALHSPLFINNKVQQIPAHLLVPPCVFVFLQYFLFFCHIFAYKYYHLRREPLRDVHLRSGILYFLLYEYWRRMHKASAECCSMGYRLLLSSWWVGYFF